MSEHARPEPCNPVDLAGLSAVVVGERSIRPSPGLRPCERVLSTLPGITHIGPVEIEPELDLPLWSFLVESRPGLDAAGRRRSDGRRCGRAVDQSGLRRVAARRREPPGHRRAALAQHPAGHAVVAAAQVLAAKGERRRHRADQDVAGRRSARQRRAGAAGRSAEAVVAFRTSLFRRYPATVVYLYPAARELDAARSER